MIRHALILAIATSCACGASARTKTLQTTLAITETAQAALLAYDNEHERELAESAKSRAEADAALLGWQQEWNKAQAALVATYKAISVAEMVNDDPSLANALKAFADLKALLVALGVKL